MPVLCDSPEAAVLDVRFTMRFYERDMFIIALSRPFPQYFF